MTYNDTFIAPFINGEDFDFLGLCVAPFVNIMGNYFWVLFGIIPVFMMYLKSQDISIPLISGILFTAAFGVAFPETLGIAILMLLSTATGAMLFMTFKGDGK